ncbi:hypothetical protein AHMF7605_10390 [Adhaeribacter arboris]|uniref:Uncharacterized protein n=1 Tax=Adhaeribacter arboris TaxID=2072846 RepID=A0A2T2YEF9_9BACT|nr:hypothetical protein [Adhaeribacter arboris]PSR53896.1 hypothetical protein AHMF7605_10390 [Adhaeribacter arboris]
MKNIEQIAEDNLGGLAVCFYTDWDNIDFTQFPKRQGLRLIGDIVLKPGATWGMLVFTAKTAGYSQPTKQDRRGTIYPHEIKGFLPRETPELAETLFEMNTQRRYLVLHRDHNGFMRLSGGPEYGLKFESKFSTQDSPDGRNGSTVSLKAESLLPALFYSGALTVTDQVLDPTSEPSGFVRFEKGNGELIALVPAGGRFQILSGFSYGFRILS